MVSAKQKARQRTRSPSSCYMSVEENYHPKQRSLVLARTRVRDRTCTLKVYRVVKL